MRSYSRISVLVFTLLLSCLSIGCGRQEVLLYSLTASHTVDLQPQASLSENQPHNVWGLLQSELVVGTVNSLPAPVSKINAGSFLSSAFSLEARIQSLDAGYLWLVKAISPGLSVGTIIYPFHYFW
ncbi:MAG: hypothetical protein KY428_01230 [Bacteroidetes bacterium]|nr:hypothetical protein [Bacteroidota bacterium]